MKKNLIYAAIAAATFAIALLIIAGCASVQPGITKCPRCGWFVHPVDAKSFRAPDGSSYYVTEYVCWSDGCGWWGYLTNPPTAKVTK